MSDTDDTSTSIPLEDLTLTYVDNIVFINPETYPDDQAAKTMDDIILKKSTELNIDHNLASLAVSEKNNSISFFEQSLDQPPHFSNDHARLREFIIDWYSAQKTFITKSKKSLDLNILPDDELNELILSLGFPYPKNISSKSHKIQFINSLFEMYKRKGTAFTLWNVLSLYGLSEVNISEWWVRYDDRRTPKIFMKSKPIYPESKRNDPNLVLIKEIDDVILTDPYWQQTKYDLLQLANKTTKENPIGLPSITPFLSISTYSNFSKLYFEISIIQRKIYETLRYWTQKTLIPFKLEDYGITEIVQDIPIVHEPPTTFPSNNYIEDNPIKNVLYMISSTPVTGSIFEGHERELARRTVNMDLSVTWDFIDLDDGMAFISRKDSVIVPNKIVKIEVVNGVKKFRVISVVRNTVIQFTQNYLLSENFRPKSTLVFNGYEWIMLNKVIPADLFKQNKVSKDIYRDVSLNGFSSLYSPYEVSLAIAYMFKNSYVPVTGEPFYGSTGIAANILRDFIQLDVTDDNRIDYNEALASAPELTEDQYDIIDGLITVSGTPGMSKEELLLATRSKKHFFYNGNYSPLDGKYGPSDNVDDFYKTSNPYSQLKLEHERLYDYDLRLDPSLSTTTFRHISPAYPYKRDNYIDPKALRDRKLVEYYSKYTKIITPGADHEIAPQQNPKSFLKAMNPEFFNELEDFINADKDLAFESILSDFEYYLINNMQVLDTPFAYAITGADFFNKKLKPVVNFFKPIRARIMDFASTIRIDDYLLDSLIPGDNDGIYGDIEKVIYEKPFPLNYFTDEVDDPVYDAGLPMNDLMISYTSSYIFDAFPTPDSPISTSKILDVDTEEDNVFMGQLDRNLLDLKMNDNLIIQITSYDSTSGIFYEYEMEINDSEYKSLTLHEKFISDAGEEVIDGLLEGSNDTFLYDLTEVRDIEAFFKLNIDTNMFEIDIKHEIDDLDTTGEGALILVYANLNDLSGASIEPTAIDLSNETFITSIDKEVHYTNLSTYEDCYLVITFQITGDPILHLKYIKLNYILDYLSLNTVN